MNRLTTDDREGAGELPDEFAKSPAFQRFLAIYLGGEDRDGSFDVDQALAALPAGQRREVIAMLKRYKQEVRSETGPDLGM